jgi:hypothetical protein
MSASLLAAMLAGGARLASAQALDANLWVTDGDVHTVVPSGNTLYVGGTFAYVGPNTGGWSEIDGSGRTVAHLPRVNGDVTGTVSDGAGGWWICGSFTQVAGIARPGIAHVLADGSVSPWSPVPAPHANPVCLAVQGSRVFAVTSVSVFYAYDAQTGDQIPSWNPAVLGPVSSMVVDGNTLYCAGDFTFTITSPPGNGSGLCAIDTNTGAIANWDPAPVGSVTRLFTDGRWLYATGTFTEIGGQSHEGLARALLTAGHAWDATWAPSIDAPLAALARVGEALWISGQFFFVNGNFVDRMAVVDTTTGAIASPTPILIGVEGQVTAMAVRSPWIYLGITPTFTFPRVQSSRPLIVRMSTADGQVDGAWRSYGLSPPTNPDVGSVTDLKLTSSGGLVASGHFISLGGRRQMAVAALDRTTGIPRMWNPNLSVTETFPVVPSVSAILPTPNAVYLGGYFTGAAGQVRKSLAAVDPTYATLRPWKADLGAVASLESGEAKALLLHQDKILVGGAFSSIAGAPRTSLALVDSVIGNPVPGWACDVDDQVNCLLPQGGMVYVGGGFTSVDGQPHNDLAAINPTTGDVSSWDPNVQGVQVWSLAAQNDTLYIAGDYSHVGGQSRFCLAAVTLSTGAVLGWAPSAFGPVMAILIQGPNLLVGGEFQFLNGQPVFYLGRVQRFTAAFVAGAPAVDDRVLALAAADGGGTYVAGSFGTFAGSPAAFVARTGWPGNTLPAVIVVRANGGEHLSIGTRYHFEYTASDPTGIASIDLEISRTGAGGPWTTLAAGLPNTGDFDWLVTGPASAGNAFLRVTARGFGGATTTDLSDAAFTIGELIAGVEPGGGALALALGPNPARIVTDLRFTLREPARVRLRLVDVQGRVAWSSPERSLAAGAHVVPCALDGVAPGLYFMRVERGHESTSTRLVVVR